MGTCLGVVGAGDPAQQARVQPRATRTVTESETVTEVRTLTEPAPAPVAPAPPPPPEPQAERVVAAFEGNGSQATRPFTVQDGWEIRWDFSGDLLIINIYTETGSIVKASAANQDGSGSGSAFQPRGGSYYLDIGAIGSWTVTVVQLP